MIEMFEKAGFNNPASKVSIIKLIQLSPVHFCDYRLDRKRFSPQTFSNLPFFDASIVLHYAV